MKKAFAALFLLASAVTAMAQVPPPVPGLPDTERRTSYSISSSTCACNVNFALYGDSTDYQNWVEVFINGVRVDYNDATYGWTITSPSGPLANLARPISNAVLTFNQAQTGTIQIVGARRPRRLSQFSENRGVAARDLNQVLTDIISQNREIWDKTNDMTGRGIFGLPGETLTLLPSATNRAGKYLLFDGNGNPSVASSSAGSGNVTGSGPSVNGHIPAYSGVAGNAIVDSGFFPVQPVTCPSNQWVNILAASGIPTCSQPTFSNISGSLASAQLTAGFVNSGAGLTGGAIAGGGTLAIDKAASTDYPAATSNKVVTTDGIFPGEVTIPYNATQPLNFGTFINASITLTGNISSFTISNVKAGQSGVIRFIQDGTGSRTIPPTGLNSIAKCTTTACSFVLSTAPNTVDLFNYTCSTATFCQFTLSKAMQ